MAGREQRLAARAVPERDLSSGYDTQGEGADQDQSSSSAGEELGSHQMFDFGRKTMEWGAYTETAEWRALNGEPRQQSFVQIYLETGDPGFAYRQVYSVGLAAASSEVARTAPYGILRRRAIQAAINRYLRKSEREILLDELAQVRRSSSQKPLATRLKAIELKAQLLGIKLPAARDDEQVEGSPKSQSKTKNPDAPVKEYDPSRKYEAGDLFVYEGQVVRATKVENGIPVQAEPAVEVAQ